MCTQCSNSRVGCCRAGMGWLVLGGAGTRNPPTNVPGSLLWIGLAAAGTGADDAVDCFVEEVDGEEDWIAARSWGRSSDIGSSLNFDVLGAPTEEVEPASGAFISKRRGVRHAT